MSPTGAYSQAAAHVHCSWPSVECCLAGTRKESRSSLSQWTYRIAWQWTLVRAYQGMSGAFAALIFRSWHAGCVCSHGQYQFSSLFSTLATCCSQLPSQHGLTCLCQGSLPCTKPRLSHSRSSALLWRSAWSAAFSVSALIANSVNFGTQGSASNQQSKNDAYSLATERLFSSFSWLSEVRRSFTE